MADAVEAPPPQERDGAPSPDDAQRPRGCTNFKLRQLLRRVSQHYDAEMARAGLKTTQYSLLTAIRSLAPVRPGDLARAMTMDASTLTRNLQPLVAAGWVLVAPGEDARSRLVSLSPAGHAKRAEAQRRWRAAQEALNARLGEARVAALHALIEGVMADLEPAADGGAEDAIAEEPSHG